MLLEDITTNICPCLTSEEKDLPSHFSGAQRYPKCPSDGTSSAEAMDAMDARDAREATATDRGSFDKWPQPRASSTPYLSRHTCLLFFLCHSLSLSLAGMAPNRPNLPCLGAQTCKGCTRHWFCSSQWQLLQNGNSKNQSAERILSKQVLTLWEVLQFMLSYTSIHAIQLKTPCFTEWIQILKFGKNWLWKYVKVSMYQLAEKGWKRVWPGPKSFHMIHYCGIACSGQLLDWCCCARCLIWAKLQDSWMHVIRVIRLHAASSHKEHTRSLKQGTNDPRGLLALLGEASESLGAKPLTFNSHPQKNASQGESFSGGFSEQKQVNTTITRTRNLKSKRRTRLIIWYCSKLWYMTTHSFAPPLPSQDLTEVTGGIHGGRPSQAMGALQQSSRYFRRS